MPLLFTAHPSGTHIADHVCNILRACISRLTPPAHSSSSLASSKHPSSKHSSSKHSSSKSDQGEKQGPVVATLGDVAAASCALRCLPHACKRPEQVAALANALATACRARLAAHVIPYRAASTASNVHSSASAVGASATGASATGASLISPSGASASGASASAQQGVVKRRLSDVCGPSDLLYLLAAAAEVVAQFESSRGGVGKLVEIAREQLGALASFGGDYHLVRAASVVMGLLRECVRSKTAMGDASGYALAPSLCVLQCSFVLVHLCSFARLQRLHLQCD